VFFKSTPLVNFENISSEYFLCRHLVCDSQLVLHGLQRVLLDGIAAGLDGRLAAVVRGAVRVAPQVDDLRAEKVLDRWCVVWRKCSM
jgi:hypothetical protein